MLLDADATIIGGVQFVGATPWTDFLPEQIVANRRPTAQHATSQFKGRNAYAGSAATERFDQRLDVRDRLALRGPSRQVSLTGRHPVRTGIIVPAPYVS